MIAGPRFFRLNLRVLINQFADRMRVGPAGQRHVHLDTIKAHNFTGAI